MDEATDETANPGKPRRFRGLKILAVLLAGSMLSGWFLTATTPGLGLLTRMAAPVLESAAGVHVSIVEPEGSLWSRFSARAISVSGPDGLALDIASPVLDWQPMQLLSGKVDIAELAADRIDISLPSGETPEENQSEPLGLPELPAIAIRLARLDLPDIRFRLPEEDQDIRLAATGGLNHRADGVTEARLDIRPVEDGSDAIRVDAAIDGTAQTLALKAVAVMEENGAFARIAGLEGQLTEALSLTIDGEGPLDTWRGRLDIAYGDLLHWRSGFAGAIAAAPAIALDGEIAFNDPAIFGLPSQLTGLYRNRMEIALAESGELAIRHIDIGLPGMFDLSGDVGYGTEGELSGNLDLTASGDLAAAFDAGAGLAEIFVSVGIGGLIDRPEIEIAASVRELDVPGILRGDANLDGRAAMTADGGLTASLSVDLATIAWSDATIGQLLGDSMAVKVSAEAAAPYDRIGIADLRIDAGAVSLRGSGEAAVNGALTGIELAATIADLSRIEPLTGQPLRGGATLRLTGITGDPETGFESRLALTGTDIGAGDPVLDRLLGKLSLTSGLRVTAGNRIELPDFRLGTTGVTSHGRIGYDLSDGVLSATLDGSIVRDALPPVDGVTLTGDPGFRIDLDGPAEKPTGTVTIDLADADAGGIGIGASRLTARLSWQGTAPRVALDLRSVVAGLELRAATDLLAARDLSFRNIRVELPGLTLTGEAILPAQALPAKGNLKIAIADARALAGLAGTDITFRGNLDARLGANGDRQDAEITGSLADIRLPDAGLGVAAADIRLALADLLGRQGIDAGLKARKIAIADANVDTLSLDANGSLAALDWRLDGAGQVSGKPAKAELSGRVARSGSRVDMSVAAGKASLGKLAATITEPVSLQLDNGAPVAAGGAVSLAGGRISAGYRKSGKQADLDLSADGLDLAPLLAFAGRDGITGQATLSLALSEKAGKTGGTIRLDLDGLKTPALPQPASLALSGSLDAGRLKLDGNLAGIDLDQATISAEVPARISLTRLSGSLPQDGALRASLRFAGDIARIWPLLPLPEHQMSGRFDIDANASGTIANPSLGGTARITGGEYEHLEFGSRLTAIALEARFDGGRLTLERLSAGDGAKGTISADGYADLGGGNLDYRFHLAANGTRLVHRDDLEAVASADIRAAGNADGGRLAGTVTIEKAEFNLAAALPPTVTTLEIENDPNRKEKDAEPASTYPLELDLQISVAGKTFVRGRGLDSEWAGKVDIAGTAADPAITGGIRAVRGQMDVVGKVFDIRDSAINFSGGPEPRLDIAGQYKTQDLEVTAKLTGPARKPELSLTSSPPLPRDEILAQVLFGQGKANLGPLQAAQLAAAAADLSGATGGGTDVIGRIRKLAGVDVLRVEDGATGPAVAAGKYIADGVYVGAKQGSKPGSGGVEVEVEVTPNISVKSEAGQTGDSNIGIQFKWDY